MGQAGTVLAGGESLRQPNGDLKIANGGGMVPNGTVALLCACNSLLASLTMAGVVSP